VTPEPLSGKSGWLEAVLVLAVAAATMCSMTRHWPAQNVLLAAAIIGSVGGLAHSVGALTGIPFGQFSFTNEAGPRLFGLVAWPLPFLWIVTILNSRGVARLILRPWRKLHHYGFWLVGITTLLTVLFAMALDPFASQVKRLCHWQPTQFPITWHGAPWTNLIGWLAMALLIQSLVTPALIVKQLRCASPRPDYHPLAVWLLGLGLFATGNFARGLWLAAVFSVMIALVTGWLAVHGARGQLRRFKPDCAQADAST